MIFCSSSGSFIITCENVGFGHFDSSTFRDITAPFRPELRWKPTHSSARIYRESPNFPLKRHETKPKFAKIPQFWSFRMQMGTIGRNRPMPPNGLRWPILCYSCFGQPFSTGIPTPGEPDQVQNVEWIPYEFWSSTCLSASTCLIKSEVIIKFGIRWLCVFWVLTLGAQPSVLTIRLINFPKVMALFHGT